MGLSVPPWWVAVGLILVSLIILLHVSSHIPFTASKAPQVQGLAQPRSDYCGLGPLARFLTTHVDWQQFAALAHGAEGCVQHLQLYGELLNALVPYIVAPPTDVLNVRRRPVPLDESGDCMDQRWSRLFTGARRTQRLQVTSHASLDRASAWCLP